MANCIYFIYIRHNYETGKYSNCYYVCMRHIFVSTMCMLRAHILQSSCHSYQQWFHVLASRGDTRGRGGTKPAPPSPSLPTEWLGSIVDSVHSSQGSRGPQTPKAPLPLPPSRQQTARSHPGHNELWCRYLSTKRLYIQ